MTHPPFAARRLSNAPTTALALTVGLTLALTACTRAPEPTPAPEVEAPTVTEAPLPEPHGPRGSSTGLAAPWSVAYIGNTALVSGRDNGLIVELAEDGSGREVATVSGVVHSAEDGLLGLAVLTGNDDDGLDDGVNDADQTVVAGTYLYAYSTGPNGNRVQRFALTGQLGSLALGEAETVVDGLPSSRRHNGGRIAFGPDGMLYVTVGDSGQPALAQRLDSLAGKILRLTPEGAVPSDNPFDGSLVFSYGHRNPQGIAWSDDGTMYASEFGQDTWDELNLIEAGANYGWPNVEGQAGNANYRDPVQQWSPADASPSGIAIVNDTIYIANLRGQRVRAVPLADLGSGTDYFVGEYGRIRDVVVAPDGTLWLLTNNTDGRIAPRDGDDRFIDSGLV